MPLFSKKRDQVVEKLLELYRRPNRYRELKQLGEGGLAVVSACFDAYLGRVVALKELKEANLENSFLVKSFVNEARMVGYLDHPGVVSVFDTFVLDKGRVCYTMTMVEGESLAKMLDTDSMFRQGPRIPMVQALEVFTKIVEAMAHVHDRGVLHLDLKPENIMVGRHGEVFIMDWGNARLFNTEPYQEYLRKFAGDIKVEPVDPERRNVVMGTPLYMSPEQTNTPRDLLTPGSDIFSAGAVFYEMLTGRRAFHSETSEEAMDKVRTLVPPQVHDLNPEVPVRLSQICAKMLEKKVYDRYRSFDEVLTDLSRLRDSGQEFATRTYEAGEVIFREGDPGEYAFSIVSGRVEIAAGGTGDRKVLASLGPGEIVGELAIFTDHPRTASATALESTTIRIMSAAAVKAEMEKLRPWVGAMIRILSERFIGLNEKLMRLDSK